MVNFLTSLNLWRYSKQGDVHSDTVKPTNDWINSKCSVELIEYHVWDKTKNILKCVATKKYLLDRLFLSTNMHHY